MNWWDTLFILAMIGLSWLAISIAFVLAYHELKQHYIRGQHHKQDGAHRIAPGRVHAVELRDRIWARDNVGKPIYLGEVVWNAQWYGVVPDPDGPTTVTAVLELTEESRHYIASLAELQGADFDFDQQEREDSSLGNF